MSELHSDYPEFEIMVREIKDGLLLTDERLKAHYDKLNSKLGWGLEYIEESFKTVQ